MAEVRITTEALARALFVADTGGSDGSRAARWDGGDVSAGAVEYWMERARWLEEALPAPAVDGEARARRCDCGRELTQCSVCAVEEWQAAHPDCRTCCPAPAVDGPKVETEAGACPDCTPYGRCRTCGSTKEALRETYRQHGALLRPRPAAVESPEVEGLPPVFPCDWCTTPNRCFITNRCASDGAAVDGIPDAGRPTWTGAFDEAALRSEVVRVFGPHGAHVEVLDMLLSRMPDAGPEPEPYGYVAQSRGGETRFIDARDAHEAQDLEDCGWTVTEVFARPCTYARWMLTDGGGCDGDSTVGDLGEIDLTLLRLLVDRRPELNACALRPGQAMHVHALERVLKWVEDAHGGPPAARRAAPAAEESTPGREPSYEVLRDTLLAAWRGMYAGPAGTYILTPDALLRLNEIGFTLSQSGEG